MSGDGRELVGTFRVGCGVEFVDDGDTEASVIGARGVVLGTDGNCYEVWARLRDGTFDLFGSDCLPICGVALTPGELNGLIDSAWAEGACPMLLDGSEAVMQGLISPTARGRAPRSC